MENGHDFYGVVAQVLPVLFVILSVEFAGIGYVPDSVTEVPARLRKPGEQGADEEWRDRLRFELHLESVYTTVMMAVFVAGEVVVLACYQTGTDTTFFRVFAWVALGCGAGACIFPMLSEQYRDSHDRRRALDEADLDAMRPWLLRIEGIVFAVGLTAVITAIGAWLIVPVR